MKDRLFATLCSLPLLLVAGGCSSTYDKGAYAPLSTDQANFETNAKFALLDPRVQHSVTCASLQEGKTADGRLQVKANVRNRENRRIEVQINCVFKDEQGFKLEETSFESLILTENETRGVEFTALSDKATAYTIRVRQAR
jgi:uncharacterized protein YcfL